jgi:hypothetical protein
MAISGVLKLSCAPEVVTRGVNTQQWRQVSAPRSLAVFAISAGCRSVVRVCEVHFCEFVNAVRQLLAHPGGEGNARPRSGNLETCRHAINRPCSCCASVVAGLGVVTLRGLPLR